MAASKKICCADCGQEFGPALMRPYKYEPEILLCESCHDERMKEEEE